MTNEHDKQTLNSAAQGRGQEFMAPWEKAFDSVLSPLDEFIHRQTTSGILLMVCAVIALVVANSGWSEAYQHLIHTHLSISLGGLSLDKSLQHWINDGLMALFFFVVGLELKREMLIGELASLRNAALPIVAALGGMLAPAAIFFLLNPAGDAARGWGIPMATDIAFAIGVLVLLGSRIPKPLITFLIALAIADDLGAVMVIALFYTEQINMMALGLSGLFLGMLIACNRGGIRSYQVYFLLGAMLWLAMLSSGVHATIAGVLTAFTIPALPKYDPARFSASVKGLIQRFDQAYQDEQDIRLNDQLRTLAHSLKTGASLVQAPLQKLENKLHLPVALIVIPIFALANAGVPLDTEALNTAFGSSITLGIIAGLVLGKFIGIAGFSWVALKLGIGTLPKGTSMIQVAGVAWLGGIGFTMAIFIGDLAYLHHPELQVLAKTGILTASLLAGIIGCVWLWLTTTPGAQQATQPH